MRRVAAAYATLAPFELARRTSCSYRLPFPYTAIADSDDCASLDQDWGTVATADPLAWHRRQFNGVSPTSRLNTFER